MTFFRRFEAPLFAVALLSILFAPRAVMAEDFVRDMQTAAIENGKAAWGYWGARPEKYTGWTTHSNRLIPVYAFGLSLDTVRGDKSIYRDAERLAALYGTMPEETLNPQADYFDQTDIARLQREAAAAGKKYIILVVFDGMDWDTTRAAAIYKTGKVAYDDGRGEGLTFQNYRGAPTDFGFFVTSPFSKSFEVDVDAQTARDTTSGRERGGYNIARGGPAPWVDGDDPTYLIGQARDCPHAVTDSAASATSMCAGIKTYNDSINVDPEGKQAETVAHALQKQGYAIGVVTSVPVSHATPACAYAHNVSRDDFQDLTRDLLGLPSVAHRQEPLVGVDVLIGAGYGEMADDDRQQGANFIPGNKYITDADLARIDVREGGRYKVATRRAGVKGGESLKLAAQEAATDRTRLFGFYGVRSGHLPFATADGGFNPTVGVRRLQEEYSAADLDENPTLAEMASAALTVLSATDKPFWLMVEAGDVDWANHDDNIDNSIGAVLSGDAAVRAIIEWVEAKDAWKDTALIVTADHGHYLHLAEPSRLASPAEPSAGGE